MRGRPSRKKDNAIKMVSVRMTKEEVNFVEEVVEEYGDGDISRSDFIREAIFYYSEIVRNKKVANA